MTKSKLIESRGLVDSKDITPRDYLSSVELEALSRFENHAAILISTEDIFIHCFQIKSMYGFSI